MNSPAAARALDKTMLLAPHPKDPAVLSYLALRKAVGIVAFGMPFALAIPWGLFRHQMVTSISGYYYTGMRNLFVGSLCAIAMFMLCCRGYDTKDEIAGIFSAVCGVGVAFLPTAPENATAHQRVVRLAHYTCAAFLFATLAFFCLVLFRMSAHGQRLTQKKLQRNRVYMICGCIILASMALIAITSRWHRTELFLGLAPKFCFESTALLAFGVAWLVKGETILKD